MNRRIALVGLLFAPFAVGLYACVGDDPTTAPPAPGADAASGADGTSSSPPPAPPPPPATDGAADVSAADASDAADAGPPIITRAFVSSALYYGDSLKSPIDADHDCQALATAAGLGGVGWRSWLSSSATNAIDRMRLGSPPIYLADGVTVVVEHGTDLVGDGGLVHAIDHDENKTAVAPALVWTGTTEHGVLYTASGANGTFGDWLVTGDMGGCGGSNQTGVAWSSDGLQGCGTQHRIYCFGPSP